MSLALSQSGSTPESTSLLSNSSSSIAKPRIVFLNRSYWPNAEATGQLLTDLAESLVDEFDVSVVCGQPNSTTESVEYCPTGLSHRHGVHIFRVRHTQFAKRSVAGKLLNLSSFAASAFFATAKKLGSFDIVISETDPFLMPLVGHRLACRHRSRHLCYVQDIYPDIAVALGVKREGIVTRALRNRLRRVYNAAHRVVVLSADMRQRLATWPVEENRLTIVPNWVDSHQIYPVKENNPWKQARGLADRFVVMYSGNLGLSQPLEPLIDAFASLAAGAFQRVSLVFVGEGANKQRLIEHASRYAHCDIQFHPYQPLSDLAQSLSAADIHIVAVDTRIRGCLMPSKIYGILASGTPMLALAELGGDTCRLIQENRIGLIASPDDRQQVREHLEWAMTHPQELRSMGQLARELAVAQYDRATCHRLFREQLRQLV